MRASIEERIAIFKQIRDIPYYISTGKEEDSCCLTKSQMFVRELRSLGLEARILITTCRWEDTVVPQSVLSLPHPPLEEHASVEVSIPEKKTWIDVDPTWDPGLKGTFDIAEWDGLSSTAIAMPWIERYDPEKSAATFTWLVSPEGIEDYLSKYRSFVIGLNNWIGEIRK